MLLKLRKVARFYGPRLIFRDISLTLHANSVTLLAGANGAGKSTLLKIMAGLIRPTSGDVVLHEFPDREPRIGYLGHQTFLYPDLSALENLRFWASLSGMHATQQDFERILERVELSSFADEKTKGFSRGMAQRLNLARVFLSRPDILLLDEPGTGLDVHSTGILHREIALAKTNGAGIVWISHSLGPDLCLADIVAYLDNKRLAFYGAAEDFARHPQYGVHVQYQTAGSRPVSEVVATDQSSVPERLETRRASGGEPC